MLKSSLRTKQAFECCIDSKEKKTGEGKVGECSILEEELSRQLI